MSPPLDVVVRFLRLGFTSFGGPVAHLGYFRREFVTRAAWLDDEAFGEMVALCSVLPGPTSSQVGMLLGLRRAGVAGGFLAWLAFTAPSAVAMGALGFWAGAARPYASAGGFERPGPAAGALLGLEGVAAAVVLIAVVAMARSLVRSTFARIAAPLAFAATLAIAIGAGAPSWTWVVLVVAGAFAAFLAPAAPLPQGSSALPRGSRVLAAVAAAAFVACLAVLPLAAGRSELLALFVTFFRSGSLVFGGGHVVLPFLQPVVTTGAIDGPRFLFGYGAVQAMPGPLSTFAAYVGAADVRAAGMPVLAALVALVGIFAPTLLLLTMAAPLWGHIRTLPRAGNVLTGLNAAVVGLLAAAFVNPIAASIARSPLAIGIAVAAFGLLRFGKLPSWAVVLLGAAAGALAYRVA